MNKNIQNSLIIIITVFFCWGTITITQKPLEAFFYTQGSQPLENLALAKVIPSLKKPKLELEAEAAISITINHAGREKILFRKETSKILPVASLTKLMTAILVLENTTQEDYSLSQVVRISKEVSQKENVPIYGNLYEGEVFTIEKLLSLMLVYSSNDAAFALSKTVSNQAFAERMNDKSEEIGLKNSHFINPTGLDPDDESQLPNYSTVEDLISLCKYITDNYPEIWQITLNQKPYPTVNSFPSLSLQYNQEFIGGKTGYTQKAGGCLIVLSKDRKGNSFINIILGSNSSEERIIEMQKLIDWTLI